MKTRREFIKDTAACIPAVALAGRIGAFAASRSKPGANGIRQFKNAFGGRVVVPADAEYEIARKASGTDKHPAIVAQCNNEQDVLRCIDFAHQYELEVAVRSGNHSFLGWGTCNEGIVVDLSKMKGIVVDPVKRTAVASPGNTAEEILAATSAVAGHRIRWRPNCSILITLIWLHSLETGVSRCRINVFSSSWSLRCHISSPFHRRHLPPSPRC